MKNKITVRSLLFVVLALLASMLFLGCSAQQEDSAANLTESNWVYVDGEDQGSVTFSDDEVTAIFVFDGQESATMIGGPYTATDSTFTVDDPNTGNTVEFTYAIDGDTLTISDINGTPVSFQYIRES